MSYPGLFGACKATLALRRSVPPNEHLWSFSDQIYKAVYAGGYRGKGSVPGRSAPTVGYDTQFVEELLRLVPDRRPGDAWLLTGVASGIAHLEQEGTRAIVAIERLVDPPTVGEPVRALEPALTPLRMPGFVYRAGSIDVQGPISRVYLNIRPSGAAWVLGDLAHRLDSLSLPFSMKVLAHPGAYYRSDAAVVYVASGSTSSVVRLCIEGLREGEVVTDPLVPLLTRRIAPGLAIADDPDDIPYPTALSHGMWVTNLLIEAATDAQDAAAMARRVEQDILAAGRAIARPYRRGRAAGAAA